MNLKAIAAKMTALLLAFSLFAALCACGKNGKEETGGQTSGTGAHDSAAEQTDGTGADEGGEKTDEEEIGFTVSFAVGFDIGFGSTMVHHEPLERLPLHCQPSHRTGPERPLASRHHRHDQSGWRHQPSDCRHN